MQQKSWKREQEIIRMGGKRPKALSLSLFHGHCFTCHALLGLSNHVMSKHKKTFRYKASLFGMNVAIFDHKQFKLEIVCQMWQILLSLINSGIFHNG